MTAYIYYHRFKSLSTILQNFFQRFFKLFFKILQQLNIVYRALSSTLLKSCPARWQPAYNTALNFFCKAFLTTFSTFFAFFSNVDTKVSNFCFLDYNKMMYDSVSTRLYMRICAYTHTLYIGSARTRARETLFVIKITNKNLKKPHNFEKASRLTTLNLQTLINRSV